MNFVCHIYTAKDNYGEPAWGESLDRANGPDTVAKLNNFKRKKELVYELQKRSFIINTHIKQWQ